jgi:hypothetical protein
MCFMPFEIAMEDSVLVITLHGTFTGRDLHELFGAVREAEGRLSFSPNRLTDLTDATGPDINHHDIAEMVQLARFVLYQNSHKSAIVAPGLLQYGFARMYQLLTNHPQIEVGVFRDIPTAQVWLETMADKVEPLFLA